MAHFLNKQPELYAEEKLRFIAELKLFHEQKGTPFRHSPSVSGKEVDLYLLYWLVTSQGGWEKINNRSGWDELLPCFGLKEATINGALALKLLYLRYLEPYEKVHFSGEEEDREDDWFNDEEDSRTRRQKAQKLQAAIPVVYNHTQHNISDEVRANSNLSKDVYRKTDYDRLALSLLAPLPNEQDFAINVCTLLSNEGKHTLKLAKYPRLLDLLLGHAGVYHHANLQAYMNEFYRESRLYDLLSFWLDVCRDTCVRDLLLLPSSEGSASHFFNLKSKTKLSASKDLLQQLQHLNQRTPCERVEALKKRVHEEMSRRIEFEDELFAVGRKYGTQELAGQRVLQIATVVRNLSFEDDNMSILAKNLTCLRFCLLCASSKWNNLNQMGFDILSNIATEIILEETTSDWCITDVLLSTITTCISSDDRFQVISSLDILNKLSQVEANEEFISSMMCEHGGVYDQLVAYLSLHDIHLLISTLECLYSLSCHGEVTCNAIVRTHGALEALISLITVEAQSYGPKACILMRVVETVPGSNPNAASPQIQPSTQQNLLKTTKLTHLTPIRHQGEMQVTSVPTATSMVPVNTQQGIIRLQGIQVPAGTQVQIAGSQMQNVVQQQIVQFPRHPIPMNVAGPNALHKTLSGGGLIINTATTAAVSATTTNNATANPPGQAQQIQLQQQQIQLQSQPQAVQLQPQQQLQPVQLQQQPQPLQQLQLQPQPTIQLQSPISFPQAALALNPTPQGQQQTQHLQRTPGLQFRATMPASPQQLQLPRVPSLANSVQPPIPSNLVQPQQQAMSSLPIQSHPQPLPQQQAPQPQPQAPPGSQQVQLRVSNDDANRQFCLSWLRATYEICNGNHIEQQDMYKTYLASLHNMGKRIVISAQHYALCVRSLFGGSVGPNRKVMPDGSVKQVYEGIKLVQRQGIGQHQAAASANTAPSPAAPTAPPKLEDAVDGVLPRCKDQIKVEADVKPMVSVSGLLANLLEKKPAASPPPILLNGETPASKVLISNNHVDFNKMNGSGSKRPASAEPNENQPASKKAMLECNGIMNGPADVVTGAVSSTPTLVSDSNGSVVLKSDVNLTPAGATTQRVLGTTTTTATGQKIVTMPDGRQFIIKTAAPAAPMVGNGPSAMSPIVACTSPASPSTPPPISSASQTNGNKSLTCTGATSSLVITPTTSTSTISAATSGAQTSTPVAAQSAAGKTIIILQPQANKVLTPAGQQMMVQNAVAGASTVAVSSSTPCSSGQAVCSSAVATNTTTTVRPSVSTTAAVTNVVTAAQASMIQLPPSVPIPKPDLAAPFLCEWHDCMKAFKTPKDVERHALATHCPPGQDDIPCLWLRCDGMKRKRFSLMAHIQDPHCDPQRMKAMALRRLQMAKSGKSEIPLPPAPRPHPGYAPNAALHAIKRHALEFVNPKNAAMNDEKEGPVTKSIRLTAALILKNLVMYSNLGKKRLRAYESHLSTIALSNVESSRTISQVLFELSDLSPHEASLSCSSSASAAST